MHDLGFGGLRDVHMTDVEEAVDCLSAVEAISHPQDWPRFQNLLDRIYQLMIGFEMCYVYYVAISANSIVRLIAKSITRDGRFHLYMTLGDLIENYFADRLWYIKNFYFYSLVYIHLFISIYICFADFTVDGK